ncbi:MBL fold metallo-hydrolase [Streptomyces sp. DSM 40750]|uniref:MBL fold metallo-hydrolase n=1 Tax=Streptomyces sp. DSM 40750 TaxID=2801030 RepID=UPI00214CFF55|nr:MBL fold metallo-hydrolase [Streptomyces sp. DSM 40750]UUU22879.1 MBL fold metallo-hydrolase [Streptomyces sp. DSM 40750]
MSPQPSLPSWLTWWQRPFPDANTLLLHGRQPTLIDTGFVAHAEETAAWARAHAGDIALVLNTHWHSDHVGGNALLQAQGAAIAAGAPEAEAISRRDPGCCAAEYLDQPVAPYMVDLALDDGQVLRLGDADWEVIRTPGHTPGHLALWQPEERLLVVGDALSDYDVGWVNLALDGLDSATTALASLKRMAALAPRVILPSHGPIPTEPATAFAAALRRAQRLVDDPDGAAWYGARRIFAFALMIRDGIPAGEVEPYLHARAWLADAARLLDLTPEALATELVTTMLTSGAVVLRDGRLHAAADHTSVAAEALHVPYPRAWPATEPR